MRTRPVSVLAAGALYIAAGAVGIAYHATELGADALADAGVIWALAVRLAAVLAGVFLLRGANWARWLALVWIAYHVVLSIFHSFPQLIMHAALLAAAAYVLLRPEASAFFRAAASSKETSSPPCT